MLTRDPIEEMGAAMGIEFLPLGKGALILILGGLVALLVSLLWSLLTPRAVAEGYLRTVPRSPSGLRPLGATVARNTAVVTPSAGVEEKLRRAPRQGSGWSSTPAGARWQVDLAEAALRMGYGRPEIDIAGPARYTVRLPSCRSCHGAAARDEGCHVERRVIERVVRGSVPSSAVVETRCRALGHGPCVFEVITGAVG